MKKLQTSKKLLVICGPTASGKTNLAGLLAKKFDGVIVSADSRQVYKGMDVGTGKDYVKGVTILGYDLVGPKAEFDVSKYLKFARESISDIQKSGKLPILVGGTGLYIKGVIEGIPTIEIPRNGKLRAILEKKSADALFENLSQLDALKAGSMNTSDKKNPRRLIRAIEIAQWKLAHGAIHKTIKAPTTSILMIGLKAPREFLDLKVEKRVEKRISNKMVEEIKSLLSQGVSWDDQSMTSLGYRQYRDFFEGDVPEDVIVSEWKREEKRYAKRQMTWFNKQGNITWFDITKKGHEREIDKLVEKWYISSHAE